MIYDRFLSASLAEGVIEWFKLHFFYMKDGVKEYYIHPSNMYSFPNTQIPVSQMPALTCWITKDTISQNYWNELGTVHLEVTFNTANQLANLAKQFNQVMSAMRAQLLANPNYILIFLQDYTPGLLLLPTLSTTDMSKYKDALNKKNSSYVHTLEMKYQINLFENQKAIWDTGRDYYSPYDEVYQEAIVDTTLILTNYKEL